jgi:succinoglycan biosynthesis protein ExoM
MSTDSHVLSGGSSRANPVRIVACVCTKDRPEIFRRCLDSLRGQIVPKSLLELHLIVVDNSLEAGERASVARHRMDAEPIIYVHEPKPGIPNARNAALNAALPLSPDWIAFIDDDEIAPAEWIARLYALAVHFKADVAAGKVVHFLTAAEAQLASENWEPPIRFGEARVEPTCATSNVIFRGSLVNGISGLRFDESMRHGGSDTEFFMRARQRGARIVCVADAHVFEVYPAERTTMKYECMRAFRVGTTTNYRYRKNYGRVRGVLFLMERIVAKLTAAFASALVGIFVYPFARTQGRRRLRRGFRNAATAFGFLGPVLGIKPGQYW